MGIKNWTERNWKTILPVATFVSVWVVGGLVYFLPVRQIIWCGP